VDTDSIPALLSPGAVFCGRPYCDWRHTGGDIPEQFGALLDHMRAEHQPPCPVPKEIDRCPPSA
jgi:hypothetical protein